MRTFEFAALQILEKYHFSRADAEAFLETIKEAKSDDLATKTDVLRLEKEITEIKREISDIKKETVELKLTLTKLIGDNKTDSLKWTFVFIFSNSILTIGSLLAIIKFFM